MEALDAILQTHDVIAVLGRDVSVQLVDLSNSGCLLQSTIWLPVGTVGSLKLSYGDEDYEDDVRVMRCQQPVSGQRWFRIGTEFLWTRRPHARSLRRLAAGLHPPGLVSARIAQEWLF